MGKKNNSGNKIAQYQQKRQKAEQERDNALRELAEYKASLSQIRAEYGEDPVTLAFNLRQSRLQLQADQEQFEQQNSYLAEQQELYRERKETQDEKAQVLDEKALLLEEKATELDEREAKLQAWADELGGISKDKVVRRARNKIVEVTGQLEESEELVRILQGEVKELSQSVQVEKYKQKELKGKLGRAEQERDFYKTQAEQLGAMVQGANPAPSLVITPHSK